MSVAERNRGFRTRALAAAVLLVAIAAPPASAADAADAAVRSFAPLGARHAPGTRYRLPFELDMPRMLTQGVGGRYSHTGSERYAFDFAMPEGTAILAARAGTVALVRDGASEGGMVLSLKGKDNRVEVLHDDGTFALYSHLRKGILVEEGQSVRMGEQLGWSGNTGFSSAPHLHFAVFSRTGESSVSSVSIRFGVGNPRGFVPEEGKFYGNRPHTNAELRIAGTGPIDDTRPLYLAPGAEQPLTVMLVAPGKAPLDVTRSPHTHYFAPMAWSTSVDETGRVRAAPTPDYAAALARLPPEMKPTNALDWGVVVVTHRDQAADRHGFASVFVKIEDATP